MSKLTGNAPLSTLTICKETAFSSLEAFVLLYSLHPTWSFVSMSLCQWVQRDGQVCHCVCVCVTRCKFSEAKQYSDIGVWSRERFIPEPCEEMGGLCSSTLNSLKHFIQDFLKSSWGRDVIVCCRLLGVGILCSCCCPCRSGHDVPVNLQQDKCYSLFCNFISPCEWKNIILKGQSLEIGLSCIFHAIGNILNSKEKQ